MRRVLLVDDEPDIREVAQLSLEILGGWQVHTASGGQEALAEARRVEPDAILLDVMMPDLDGPTVVQRLREDEATRSVPVVLLTAKTQQTDRARFAELGVAGVLPKPFDPATLATEVARTLGWDG